MTDRSRELGTFPMAERSLEGAVDHGRNGGSRVSVDSDNQTCSPPPPPPPLSCWDSVGSSGGSSSSSWLPLPRDLRLGLLFAGLALSCLLLYNSTSTLKFIQTSYLGSTSGSSAPQVRNKYSLEEVLKAAAMEDKKTVILTTLNDAWAESGSLFDLFLKSFRAGNGTLKLIDHLVVMALDKKAFDRCLAVHRHCVDLTTKGVDYSGEADFMSADYLELVWRRIDFLGVVLQKGYDFVSTDADIMWLRSPFPHFYPDADFQISCDGYQFGAADKRNLPNSGFTYVRSNNRTVEFYKFWYQSRKSFPGLHDQDVLNKIKFHQYLSDIGLQMRFMDTAYFGGFCELSRDLDRICTVHANCCVGLDNKIHDLSIVLDDWKKYKANGSGRWSVPKDCIGSFQRPHKPHRHGLHRRR